MSPPKVILNNQSRNAAMILRRIAGKPAFGRSSSFGGPRAMEFPVQVDGIGESFFRRRIHLTPDSEFAPISNTGSLGTSTSPDFPILDPDRVIRVEGSHRSPYRQNSLSAVHPWLQLPAIGTQPTRRRPPMDGYLGTDERRAHGLERFGSTLPTASNFASVRSPAPPALAKRRGLGCGRHRKARA